MTTIKERVEKGAALLDEKRPGWEKEIDLDGLVMESGTCCVLGQLYEGSFYKGKWAILPEWGADSWDTPATEHGFTSQNGVYVALTRAWKRLIRERRK